MARTLLIETRMCLTVLQGTYQRVEERVDEHTRIIEALRAGDEKTALALLEAHMEDAVQRPRTTRETRPPARRRSRAR